jgi:hypothetical protein
MFTPRNPSPAMRSASRTQAAMSQAGMTGMGMNRSAESCWTSAMASL